MVAEDFKFATVQLLFISPEGIWEASRCRHATLNPRS